MVNKHVVSMFFSQRDRQVEISAVVLIVTHVLNDKGGELVNGETYT